jgi:hypothetical protein
MDVAVNGQGNGADRPLAVILAIAAVLMVLIAAGGYFEVAHRNTSLKVALAIEEVRKVKRQTRAYFQATGVLPADNKDLNLPASASMVYSNVVSVREVLSYTITVRDGAITLILGPDQSRLAGQWIRYSPVFSEGKLRWTCTSTVPGKYLPPKCQT